MNKNNQQKKRKKFLAPCIGLMATLILGGWGTAIPASAEASLEFARTFGGTGYDSFTAMDVTADGGYVAVGHSYSGDYDLANLSKGLIDAIIVKFGTNGSLQWKKTFGGSRYEYFYSVQATADGGCVAVGYTDSSDGDLSGLNKGRQDAIIVKYREDGSVEWKKNFGGSGYDSFQTVLATADGGYVALGDGDSTDGDFSGLNNGGILVKFDANGTVKWKKNIGEASNDGFHSMQATADGGYVLVGLNRSSNEDALLLKVDANGSLQWKKTFGGSSSDFFTSVQETDDGGYMAVGYSQSSDGELSGLNKGETDAILVKFDVNGAVQWKKSFGGSRGESFYSVQKTSDGGYVLVGVSMSSDGDLAGMYKGGEDALLVRVDANGVVQSKITFGGSDTDTLTSVHVTADGGYVATGHSRSWDGNLAGIQKGSVDALLIKVSDSIPLTPATFTVDKTELTNTDVLVTIKYPSQATIKEYKLGATGVWQSYTTPIVLSSNNTIYARSKDAVGTLSEESSYVVNNIDKVAPSLATFTADKTESINENVMVSISYPTDATVKEYRIRKSEAWNTYTAPITVTSNNTVYARSKDQAGNTSDESSYVVSNIDKVAPTSPILSRNKNVVSIQSGTDADSGVKETLVNINDGGWNVYTTAFTLADGEYDIQAKTIDKAGNESPLAISRYSIFETALQNASEKVKEAEQGKTQDQVDKAKDLVDALPASPEKDDLLDRLKDVQDQIDADKALQDATQKVIVAETTRQQSDIDTARNAVNALPDSASKKDLQDRLDAIVPNTGETTPPTEEEDIIPNKDLPGEIGKLTDPAVKQTFSDILKAIERAEANPTNRVLVQLAWDKVNAVPDSVKNNLANKKIFNSLYKRAEKLKNDFNAGLEQEALQLAIKKATDYVVSYEKYKLTTYKTKAQDAVNALPDGETKTALQARIDAVVMKTA